MDRETQTEYHSSCVNFIVLKWKTVGLLWGGKGLE